MLRDLDQRGAGPVKAGASGTGSLQNTVSVSAAIKPVARSTWRLWLAAFLLLAGLAGAAWFRLQHPVSVAAPASAAVALAATPPSSAPASAVPAAQQAASESVAAAELANLKMVDNPAPVVAETIATSKLS